MGTKDAHAMANSVYPDQTAPPAYMAISVVRDQTAPLGAVLSGSTPVQNLGSSR